MKNGLVMLAAGALVAGSVSFATVTPADAQSRGAPRGSYSRSCSDAYVNQGRLYADCRDNRGRTRATSIVLNRCSSSDISNDDGRLVCHNYRGDYENNGRPGANRPGNNGRPDDNGRPGYPGNNNNSDRPGYPGNNNNNNNNNRYGSITVYRDSDYRGQQMTFDREVYNLRTNGMNDAISAIRVSRGSAWEVCEDANFRGRCMIVRGDMRDLVRNGWNDKISSMRPVGRR